MIYGNDKWLDRLNEMISEHLKQHQLGNEELDSPTEQNESQLDQRLHACSGLPKDQYGRLQQAKQYLEVGTYKTVEEVSAVVGYTSTNYFICQFEKAFGKAPQSIIDGANK